MSLIYYSSPKPGRSELNMAFDEWLLAQAIKRPGEIFLRLYRWEVGTISFGNNQRAESALDHTLLGGADLIRRVTGGRALYHDCSELTYCIAFSTEPPPCGQLAGSISETSVAIAEAIRAFLVRVGIRADWVRSSSTGNGQPEFFHKAPCFASSARYELMHEGQKVVASAQRRFGSGLMQHGSIKLGGVVAHPALDNLSQVEKTSQPIVKKEFGGYARLFGEIFASHLEVDLVEGGLDGNDQAEIREYAHWVNENRVNRRLKGGDGLGLLGLVGQSV